MADNEKPGEETPFEEIPVEQPSAKATTPPAAETEPAAGIDTEVPLMTEHDLFRTMAQPTQNAHLEGQEPKPGADGTEAGNTPPQTDPITGKPITEPGTTTPGGQPAQGNMGVHTSNVSATAVVGMFDFIFAVVIAVVFSKIIGEDYRASDGEKNELAKALAPALAASGIVVSPWWNVLIVTAAIYGPKGYAAYKKNEELKAAQAKFDRENKPGQPPAATPPQAPPKPYQNNPAQGFAPPPQQPTAPPVEPAFKITAPEPISTTAGRCKTCNASLKDPKKSYCDRECAARFEVDRRRIDKNQLPMYVGLNKDAADKVAKANARKKPKTTPKK